MTIHVSVVVPTFERPRLLRRCVWALLDQDFDPLAYEILVVDEAHSDITRRFIEQLAHPHLPGGYAAPCLRYIPVTQVRGPAAARNCGWRAARGEIIAFTDDDCVPAPDWLERGVAAFGNDVVGVCGRTIMPLPKNPSDYERNAAQLEKAKFATANCFYRRHALAAVGGFDERFSAAWREDSDLYFRLLKHIEKHAPASRLVQTPEAIVVHPVRAAPWGASLLQQRKSQFNALLYKKHPTLYRKHVQPLRPRHYYYTVGALAVALLSTLLGYGYLVWLAAAVWLFFTARFCRRRLQGTSTAPHHVFEMIATSALIPPLSIFYRLRGALKYHVFFW